MMIQSSEDETAKMASSKKPKDKPKRPLSAYNIFFKEERIRILTAYADEPIPSESQSSTGDDSKSSDKKRIGFESLAKLIGRRWQELDEESMAVYKSKASVDMDRYKREMKEWGE